MSTKKKRERREAKKSRNDKIRNMAIITVAAIIVGGIIAYNYSVEQTKQKGLEFGMKLESIQDEVKTIQTTFYSEKAKWEEGEQSREQLLEFYDKHVNEFESIIDKYDKLEPPGVFKGSVELLKLSSQAQLESDIEYIKWVKADNNASKIRSDVLLQDALEYELMGLVEFYSAKTGVTSYDDTGEKFSRPKIDNTEKINQVVNHMIAECNTKFNSGNIAPNDTTSSIIPDVVNPELAICITKAEEWGQTHTRHQ